MSGNGTDHSFIWESGQQTRQCVRVTGNCTYPALEIRKCRKICTFNCILTPVTAETPLINTLHTLSIFDLLQIPTTSRGCLSHSCWEPPGICDAHHSSKKTAVDRSPLHEISPSPPFWVWLAHSASSALQTALLPLEYRTSPSNKTNSMSSMYLSGPISEIQPRAFPDTFMEVHNWSPVINGWWTCNSTHPHTHRPQQLCPMLHSCRKDTRWWTSSSIVTSSSLPGCSHWHRLSTHYFFDAFTPIFGFPNLCWVKMQCWSGSAAAMHQTPWILRDEILCFLKVRISPVAHCNHLAHWGHGGIIPDSIPAWPSTGNWLLPLCSTEFCICLKTVSRAHK